MEELVAYIETRLECARKYGTDYATINAYRMAAYGASDFYGQQAFMRGDEETYHKIEELWNSKYYDAFVELFKRVS
jgi:hypothetical protein